MAKHNRSGFTTGISKLEHPSAKNYVEYIQGARPAPLPPLQPGGTGRAPPRAGGVRDGCHGQDGGPRFRDQDRWQDLQKMKAATRAAAR